LYPLQIESDNCAQGLGKRTVLLVFRQRVPRPPQTKTVRNASRNTAGVPTVPTTSDAKRAKYSNYLLMLDPRNQR
jgi:hypothetical protein